MPFHLQVLTGHDKGRAITIPEGAPLVAGRLSSCPIFLSDTHISRQHCQFQSGSGRLVVTDLNSTAGTLVNGRRITQYELKPGDIIQLGGVQLRAVCEDPAEFPTLPPALGQAQKSAPSVGELRELTGSTLGHYEVGHVLGEGTRGVVFQARDTRKGETVALKVLHPDISTDDEEMQRFIRAMKTMLPIRHPHLVTIHSAGKTGPLCWVAMELVDGQSLAQVLAGMHTSGAVDWRAALRVGSHLGRALVFAHYHQIIHRNITPPNILVNMTDQVVKLGDLMLAKALDREEAYEVTRPGAILGDVRYLAPERTESGVADVRSDLYSVGATIYACLIGRPPFEGVNVLQTVLLIREQAPVPPRKALPAVPERFENVILRLLAKKPEERLQSARDLLVELEAIARQYGVKT
jgi:serine/threonine protein kinase